MWECCKTAIFSFSPSRNLSIIFVWSFAVHTGSVPRMSRCFATTTNSFYSVPFNFSLDNNIWPFQDPTFCIDTSLAEWFDLGFCVWFFFPSSSSYLMHFNSLSFELLWHYLPSLLSDSGYFANQLGTTAVVWLFSLPTYLWLHWLQLKFCMSEETLLHADCISDLFCSLFLAHFFHLEYIFKLLGDLKAQILSGTKAPTNLCHFLSWSLVLKCLSQCRI